MSIAKRRGLRLAGLLCSALLLGGMPACGGSSGSPSSGDGGSGGPTRTAQQITQDILNGCAQSSVAELTDLLTVIAQVPGGGVGAPSGRVTGTRLLPAPGIDWAIDLDADATDDGTGTSSFPNPSPALLALFGQVIGGTITPEAALQQLPDGTVVETTFSITQAFTSTGTVTTTIVNPGGGVPATPGNTSGQVTTTQPGCVVTYTWQDIDAATLNPGAGAYPVGVFNMDVNSDEGDLTGVLTMDGSSTGTLVATLQPTGEQSTFLVDLDTGQATPA